jgi:2-polyprenyl-3-methyl-5-hydroxy-6-metoxy-1,4-benzoquinol methylase
MSTYDYGGIQIDLCDYNNSYMLAFAMIRPGSSVLDLGCSDGSFAKLLVEQLSCKVWGVELNKAAGEKAREFCQDVSFLDLDEVDLGLHFSGHVFDTVVCLDVLEHLKDPVLLLKSVKPILAPNGYVVASIPNIAHISVRLSLLRGIFNYTDYGLLDRTHLRFFNKDSVYQLFDSAGYKVVSLRRVTRQLGQTEINLELNEDEKKLASLLMNDMEAQTYQFSVVGVPKDSTLTKNFPVRPLAFLQDRIRELEMVFERYKEQADEYNHDLRRNLSFKEQEIAELKKQIVKEQIEKNELSVKVSEFNTKIYDLENEISNMQSILEQANQHAQNLQDELLKLKNSRSFKLARMISLIFRFLRRII